MSFIQPVSFRTWEMELCKMPCFELLCFQTGVFKTGVAVASGKNEHHSETRKNQM